ncbi:MAG: methyltransferase [Candidatus Bathyarchaeota archaeon]|nr:MAG: methyltransferase [Candidatus Bathyarchaeota archaeon]
MPSLDRSVTFRKYRFLVDPEVYFPAEDTFLFADHLSVGLNETVMDMGTGCGFFAILSAEKASDVLAVDINPRAVACTRKNVVQNSVGTKVETFVGDLFNPIRSGVGFDLILFNAPYLPVEVDEGDAWIQMAWAGGSDGRCVIERFIDQVPNYLSKEGRVLLMQSTLSSPEATLRRFKKQGLNPRIIAEEHCFFEKIALIEASRK